ncbi:hypothetical protein [Kitasatospora sp. NBC_01302]|uniref:hypothetical protein n=1 Tax=Kitasatospora sp. NBC_01302 TaxID=2903575 RepID=UPI002E138856|nr:hypothetical protein OG294_20075 [Kitasatospora sp. NBC_01302]
MNGKGKLPPETPQNGTPQSFQIRSGNSSPVNVYAPQSHAPQGGTANANVSVNPPAELSGDVRPKSRWRDPKILGIGTVLLVLIGAATLYYTVFPNH